MESYHYSVFCMSIFYRILLNVGYYFLFHFVIQSYFNFFFFKKKQQLVRQIYIFINTFYFIIFSKIKIRHSKLYLIKWRFQARILLFLCI
ncbi:hypothetical protein J3Q64DRAFT_1762293 [Phycomyces blakesleeanus]|uniref:Transmembrane protein n=1 Tax=Phycomyces blakesleeanus TaxID=4837 RepID=A0ABR3APM1_PHYBL